MRYTVQKLATTSGVSVRTLHYYDEIGLLHPSFVAENGYRYYEEKELLRLQQILFFKELDFHLEEIKRVLDTPGFDQVLAFRDQRNMLELQKERIERLIQTIDRSIEKVKGDEHMNDDQMFNAFDKQQLEEYQKEAEARWGHTEAYKQSMERTKNFTHEDYARMKRDGAVFVQKLSDMTDRNIADPEVQKMVADWHEGLRTFYEPDFVMMRNLGHMYVADKRFTKFYDRFKPGVAEFFDKAISYYCDQNEGK